MDLFEKINKAFGGWYEGLFGGSDDVRPKDILRKILVAMEEHRKEGFDNKVYVPNQYILEISVDDEEEKEYLLSFLDRDELETAIRRYCQQNHYQIRGGLDFTIKEVEGEVEGRKREKVRVRCRYDSKLAAEKPAIEPVQAVTAAPAAESIHAVGEEQTVYEVGQAEDSEPGTMPAVALARLTVQTPGKATFEAPISRGVITIGRSARAANDVVLADDGLVSRRHARIELDADGRFTIYDLDTTNGTRVNGRRIDNRTLSSGDEIVIGSSRIVFHQEHDSDDRPSGDGRWNAGGRQESSARAGTTVAARPARLILMDGAEEIDEFVLASETLIGRGVTNDIVLADRSVATRHARLSRGERFTLESLDPEAATSLNGNPVIPGAPVPLSPGDRIGIGAITLRFEEDRS